MSILIVDDDPVTRKVLAAMLASGGLGTPTQASSAVEALQLLRIDDPTATVGDLDLILSDVMMPEMDGIQLCTRLKADPRFSDIPVIMVTSMSETSYLQMAFVAGATDYVTKPVQSVELLARARTALRLKHELDRQKEREAALREMAARLQSAEMDRQRNKSIDVLTGLPGKPSMRERAEWYAARSRAGMFGIILAEVDNFEGYRAHYGPAQGDILLQRTANALRTVTGHMGDVLARYDDRVFAIILPETTVAEAKKTAEDVRAVVETQEIEHAQAGGTVSVSVGAVVADVKKVGGVGPLLSRAETARDRVRVGGGNRIEVDEA